MRTSRVSQDTARILAATRTQRTLRQTRSRANIRSGASANGVKSEDEDSGSDLSSYAGESSSDGESRPVKRRRKGGAQPIAVKLEKEDLSITTILSPKKPKRARRAPAKKITAADGTVKIEPPPNWEEMYALTREMRNENIAPVDTMGCESLAERHRSPRDRRFQTLIALMLSSQTKDTVTAVAMRGMQDNMAGGFNLESVLAIEPDVLNNFIGKVGFHNLKTKYIKQTAELLRDKWNSEIPDTIEGLVSLPGVGPKMAYLTMSAAWGKDLGIGVDVHVHRITNLWGWNKTQNPEQTRAALESWLPQDKWHDINNLLVGFGQTICLPVGRKCGDCKLADRGLCPSAVVTKSTKVKKEKVVVKVEASNGERASEQTSIVAKIENVKAEETEDRVHIKAENADDVVPDMEDIGKAPSPRASRRR